MSGHRIVAVGLLTQHDLALLGPTFDRLWPVDETPHFSQLLEAIDEADRVLDQQADSADGEPDPERKAVPPYPGRR